MPTQTATAADIEMQADAYLAAAAEAQETMWDSLSALEKLLGFEINTNEVGQLGSWTLADLRAKFAPTTSE